MFWRLGLGEGNDTRDRSKSFCFCFRIWDLGLFLKYIFLLYI